MSSVPTTEELNVAMMAVRAGTMAPEAFFGFARRKLGYIAREVWHGWRRKLPSWVELEDVEQVLHMQVLHFLPQWDPMRCERIWDYVIWSATRRTQRQIHKWRGAQIHGNEGKNPSRTELSFSRFFKNDVAYQQGDESRLELFLTSGNPGSHEDAEERVDRAGKFDEVLQQARTVIEALVLHALRACDGSIRDAAATLWGDFSARVECGLRDERDAERVVREVVKALARRCDVHPEDDLYALEDEEVA